MSEIFEPVVYQIKIVLQGISPMIWRRLLVKSDRTIKDLHYIIQIAMGWEDIHLHYFTIHGQQYGVSKPGGMNFNTDASVIKLSQFEFREKEKDENAEIDREEAAKLQTWLLVYENKFDRQLVNERLEQYMLGDRESIFFEQEIL